MGAATTPNQRIRQLEDEVRRLRPYAEAYGGERLLPISLLSALVAIDYVTVYGVKREGISRNPTMESRPPYDVTNEPLRRLRQNAIRDLETLARKYENQLDRIVGQDWSPALTESEVKRWLGP